MTRLFHRIGDQIGTHTKLIASCRLGDSTTQLLAIIILAKCVGVFHSLGKTFEDGNGLTIIILDWLDICIGRNGSDAKVI